jgi:hypothetical protein
MHLLTFLHLKKPGPIFRLAVLVTQGYSHHTTVITIITFIKRPQTVSENVIPRIIVCLDSFCASSKSVHRKRTPVQSFIPPPCGSMVLDGVLSGSVSPI